MDTVIGSVLGLSVGVVALVFYACLFTIVFGWPLMAYSAMRSLRKIAREIERANDYREHYDNGVRSGPLGT